MTQRESNRLPHVWKVSRRVLLQTGAVAGAVLTPLGIPKGVEMATCECGCGGAPATGQFLPGHDQKLPGELEQSVGGLLALRELVRASIAYSDGILPLHPYSDRVRVTLASRRSRPSA